MFFFNDLWSDTVPVPSAIQLHMEELSMIFSISPLFLYFQNKCATTPGTPTITVVVQSFLFLIAEWKVW